jgi:hydrogenase maturation protein HypF
VVERAERPVDPGAVGFRILDSSLDAAATPVLSPDLATCARCRAELLDSGDRRADYPLITCAQCGPRWSIAADLPWDRARTTMRGFRPCSDCAAEYADVADRRFHAQTVACHTCGPRLDATIDDAVARLRGGGILALKSVGGWQLLCDARDPAAVQRLRARKGRPEKPLAVLLPAACDGLGDAERRLLEDPAAPIVLVDVDLDLAPAVTFGRRATGVLLPPSGVHLLLARRFDGPLVCTSGNRAGEPVRFDDGAAPLEGLADGHLGHDRPILRPQDDSVARIVDGAPVLLRRARGYVPTPIELSSDGDAPTVLALGAHVDGTACLATGGHAILTPHIGTLDRTACRDRLRGEAEALLQLFAARPDRLVCDLHPDYGSTRVAEALAEALGVPLRRVQHHHAHIAALMAEHRVDGPVLGFAWDGAGLGTDGTIWGGEVLRCEGADVERVAHLLPFPLPGGDAAARSPARSLLGLSARFDADDPARGALESELERAFDGGASKVLMRAIRRGLQAPLTSSMGRLFDGVAYLLGGPAHTSWRAQAAIGLEELAAASEQATVADPWRLACARSASGGPLVLDWRPTIRALVGDRAGGVPPTELAARFHGALVEAIVEVARTHDVRTVALGGGCFQNALLLSRARRRLRAEGFEVLTARSVPPGDGGLSLGQAWLGRWP